MMTGQKVFLYSSSADLRGNMLLLRVFSADPLLVIVLSILNVQHSGKEQYI